MVMLPSGPLKDPERLQIHLAVPDVDQRNENPTNSGFGFSAAPQEIPWGWACTSDPAGIPSKPVSVPEHPLHFGPRTSITTPLKSKGLGFGLSWSCTLKYASSRGCGNVLIPQGFPKSVGRVESRFLGFPCFPYSVISMTCFGNARRTIKILQGHLGNGHVLSEPDR